MSEPKSLLASLPGGFAALQTPKDRANGGVWMDVPDNPGARIRLRYLDGDAVSRVMFARTQKRSALASAAKRRLDYDASRDILLDRVASATVEWEGLGPVACTFENARAIYAELDVLFDAAYAFAADRSSFGLSDPEVIAEMGNGSPPSSTTT